MNLQKKNLILRSLEPIPEEYLKEIDPHRAWFYNEVLPYYKIKPVDIDSVCDFRDYFYRLKLNTKPDWDINLCLDMHGCEDTLLFRDNTFLKYDELEPMFRYVNQRCNNKLNVVMGVCHSDTFERWQRIGGDNTCRRIKTFDGKAYTTDTYKLFADKLKSPMRPAPPPIR